jgi:hypothetical protein
VFDQGFFVFTSNVVNVVLTFFGSLDVGIKGNQFCAVFRSIPTTQFGEFLSV